MESNNNEQNQKIILTQEKLKKLIELNDIEEFYYLMNILDDKDIQLFLDHYKKANFNKIIQSIINSSNNANEFRNNVKLQLVNNLKEELENLKSQISEYRKLGMDMYYLQIKSIPIPQKINIFKSTSQKKDYHEIKKRLDEIKNELNLIKENQLKNKLNKENN